jgi:hypothetical protein
MLSSACTHCLDTALSRISGLKRRSLRASCLRFTTAVTRRHARLASSWWSAFAGRSLSLRGIASRGFSLTSRPPRPGFAWRTRGITVGGYAAGRPFRSIEGHAPEVRGRNARVEPAGAVPRGTCARPYCHGESGSRRQPRPVSISRLLDGPPIAMHFRSGLVASNRAPCPAGGDDASLQSGFRRRGPSSE